MRCYDSNGTLIEMEKLSDAIHMVVATDGFIEINYLNPKDPRKCGEWSDTTTVRPLRLDQLLDKSALHLCRYQLIAYLCFVRSLEILARTMEKKGMMSKITPGSFWVSDTAVDAAGNPLPLKSETLSKLIQKQCQKVGLTVCHNETATQKDNDTKLAGHFLRGHAGSLAYDLYKMGSTWPSDEGINRARHTFSTFFKNYYRATNRRTVLSYAAARERGKKLRFEEAARL